MKYTITGNTKCSCGREVDVVNKLGKEFISWHLDPAKKKGWCALSMKEKK